MKDPKSYKSLQQFANAIARYNGAGKSDAIIVTGLGRNTLYSHTRYGWRKNTTGQYVPNSYRSNFGWKNTFYQHAFTVVQVTKEVFDHFNAVAE